MLLDDGNFDLGAATQIALRILSRNSRGYFLMVESDLHADDVALGLAADGRARRDHRAHRADRRTRRTPWSSSPPTTRSTCASAAGKKGESLLAHPEAPKPALRRDKGHTGEEVVVAAKGPGAERVRGFFPNTYLFQVMMAAYGWKPDAGPRAGDR